MSTYLTDFDRIKDALPLLQVITQETGLKMKGHHLEECPFCQGHECFSIKDQRYKCFQCNAAGDIRKFDYIDPFSTRDRINGFAMGIIKDGQRFDPRLVVKQDYDFFLMSLYWKRFIWRDDRYAFLAKHYTNKGGLCAHRSINKEIECIKILQQKFGKHVVETVKDKHWKVVLKKL